MDGHILLRWLMQVSGALLILLVLLDVFFTVLYARIGTGIISDRLAYLTWRLFRLISKPFPGSRGAVLTFCGPAILALLVAVWGLTLTCGTALIIQPVLGTSVTAGSGPTPTDFITAMYTGGSSVAIVGASDLTPQTGAFRIFYLFNSLVGVSIISLTLTYLMQVYTALQQRNAFGLNVYLLSAETGDAAELIAGLGPKGRFDGGYTNLTELSGAMTNVKESHHFYSVLFYFRFHEPHYSVSRFTLVSLDTVTLIKSALDNKQYSWLKESASVAQLWRASMRLVTTLEDTFLPGGVPDLQGPPDGQTLDRWRRRYFAALRRLRQAGIETIGDEQAGAEIYVSLRAQWDLYITTLAPSMSYSMDEIDPAGSAPESADKRREFRTSLV